METIDETKIATLLKQGLSQRAIAGRLNISRSTLRRHLEKQKGVPKGTMGTPQPESNGTPSAHLTFPFADELTRSMGELQEVLAWWRERKQSLAEARDGTRKRRRQTYHVEERHIEAIRRAADLERTDLAEIVNRAFARYFAEHQGTT
jgi:DNA-binding transcriptional regulator YiaG